MIPFVFNEGSKLELLSRVKVFCLVVTSKYTDICGIESFDCRNFVNRNNNSNEYKYAPFRCVAETYKCIHWEIQIFRFKSVLYGCEYGYSDSVLYDIDDGKYRIHVAFLQCGS